MMEITVGYIGIMVLIILLFSGIHIGVIMGLVGFLGMGIVSGWKAAFGMLSTVPYITFANYNFSVAPLFILMGQLCFVSGISSDLYRTAHKFLGNLRGGLAVATVGACGAFAAVSGSSMATAATMATVALPEMRKYKYDPELATGTMAAGGTLGALIPPSIPLVIYGILTETSIGKLFLASFLPGLLMALLFMGVIFFKCRLNPSAGPSGPKTTWREKIGSLKNTWIVLALFLLVIGGIYFGVFSPTEAGGVGACGAFFFALVRRRLSWKDFKFALVTSAKTTGMIFFILVGAMMFGYFLAVTRLPVFMADFIGNLTVNRYIILTFITILYIFLGCVMDSLAMILLTIPVIFPVATSLGFDAIWFGVMVVLLVEVGMITPPIGMNVFVIRGMAKDVSTLSIFRGIVHFVVVQLLLFVILTIWPEIVLIIPRIS